MRRYAKDTRLLAELHKVDAKVLLHGRKVLKDIGPILMGTPSLDAAAARAGAAFTLPLPNIMCELCGKDRNNFRIILAG